MKLALLDSAHRVLCGTVMVLDLVVDVLEQLRHRVNIAREADRAHRG
jgi:hypothetical protein